MTKKLFIIAMMMLCASFIYYGFEKLQILDNTESKVVNADDSIVASASTSEVAGIYTAAVDEKDCKNKKMTLEVLASSTSFLTEEFVDCKAEKELKSWEGNWRQEGDVLSVGLKSDTEEQKFDFVITKNTENTTLQSNTPKVNFVKTNFKNYKSEYKNISAEYGQYSEEYFVRLWAPNGVLLATLKRDPMNNYKYTDGAYTWEIGATSTLLSASSTNETFIEQTNEQN